jgi:exodeoxyribonuclease V alpha subunit
VETLHTLLAYQPYSGRFARTADDPLDADWVLLDEASMADAFLLAALVKALPPTAGLVLVGDPDQLPSVEAGSVLRELLPDDGAAELSEETWNTLNTLFPEDAPVPGEKRAATGLPPSVTLNESRRATGDILHLASAIKTGEEEKVLGVLGDPLPLAEAFSSAAPVARLFAPAEDFARALPDLLEAYADALFLKRRVRGKTYGEWLDTFRTAPATEEEALLPILWEFHTAARILAPARRGPLSAERVNRLLSARLEPLFSLRGEDGRGAFHGAPVLITRNDARTGLANGESGLWLHSGKSGSRGLQAYFPRPGCWLRLPAALLPAFETGFASTVHKSQGSEYNLALLVLPEAGNRLLARETLYTGVTRARDRVLIFASEASLREAARHLLRRDSGLRGWFT